MRGSNSGHTVVTTTQEMKGRTQDTRAATKHNNKDKEARSAGPSRREEQARRPHHTDGTMHGADNPTAEGRHERGDGLDPQ